MDWFFTDEILKKGDSCLITGEDADHIKKSLRMSAGEVITLCGRDKSEYPCIIEHINADGIQVRVSDSLECTHEPDIEVTLYFALTKGDKPETVIQKSVELGVHTIIPMMTERCISRPDAKSMEKKLIRYRKIALQAAMQSRRGIIPEVGALTGLTAAAGTLSQYDRAILFYEGGGEPLRNIITPADKKIAVFIGPEGGFEEHEAAALRNGGAHVATLGKRILRAETAPLAALSAIMFHTGNLE